MSEETAGAPRPEQQSGQSALHAEQMERSARRSKQLSAWGAEVAGELAEVERDVARVHEGLAREHPEHGEYASKAEHAKRSAERAEQFARSEQQNAEAD